MGKKNDMVKKLWGISSKKKFDGKVFMLLRRDFKKDDLISFMNGMKEKPTKYRIIKKGKWRYLYLYKR